MKILKLFILFLLSIQLQAQPCNGPLTFSLQSQIDSFPIKYPDCTRVVSSVNIEGNDITNLNGLNALEEITGNLVIQQAAQLTNIDALGNLKKIGNNLEITEVPMLSNLDSLDELSTIGRHLILYRLNSLADIKGLNQLTSIGSDCSIRACPRLKDLKGLNNLQSVDGLKINEMDSLLNIQALGNLETITGSLHILYTEALSNLDGLEKIENIGRDLRLTGNKSIKNINGLSNVKTIESTIWITANDSLLHINALSNLQIANGQLSVSSNDRLTHIDGLQNISRVGGAFTLSFNDGLISIEGLSSLESVGGSFRISENPKLESLKGLSKLDRVTSTFYLESLSALTQVDDLRNFGGTGGSILIQKNDHLKSLKGFSNLTSAGKFLQITENKSLRNLDGFENLSFVGESMTIASNDSLSDIKGIKNVNTIMGYLTISRNPMLSYCAINAVCNHLRNGGDHSISENGPDCNSAEEVLELCELFGLSGHVYYDYNQNQQRDSFEGSIPLAKVVVSPGNDQVFSDQQGRYLSIAEEGRTYRIQLEDHPDWQLTTDSVHYTLLFEQGNPDNLRNDFGLYPTFSNHNYALRLNSNPTRCNTEVKFYLRLRNQGSFLEPASRLVLQYPPTVEFIDASLSPTSIDLSNQQLIWEIDSLYPWAAQSFTLNFDMPGVDQLGDSILFTTTAFRQESGTMVEAAQHTYQPLLLCAYDPNDKLVFPPGVLDKHYTLKEETFDYTIRFQNTGNASAIDVLLIDSLDNELDWSTFQLQEASHAVQSTLSEQGILRFYFPDINLPDSTTSYTESQGFVSFQIDPLPGLADSTRIENRAYIYFDSNPPIITNTTFNTLVDELPMVVSTHAPAQAVPFFKLYPNPAEQQVNWQIKPFDRQHEYDLELVDLLGNSLSSKSLIATDGFQLEQMPAGLYWVILKHRQTGQMIQAEALQVN